MREVGAIEAGEWAIERIALCNKGRRPWIRCYGPTLFYLTAVLRVVLFFDSVLTLSRDGVNYSVPWKFMGMLRHILVWLVFFEAATATGGRGKGFLAGIFCLESLCNGLLMWCIALGHR